MSVFSDIVERLRTLVVRRAEERDLEEELRFHLTMEAEQLQERVGLSADEAHRRSILTLGGVEQIKEEVRDARGTRFVEDSGNDFKLGLRSLRKSPGWELSQVVATTGDPDGMIVPARRLLQTLDPELVMFKPVPLANVIGFGVATRVFTLRVLTAFAIVALFLAALGLYGVLSYSVKLRTREFGIRMALGANRASIRNMVMKRGLTVASAGIAIGFGGALALSRVMASMVFEISPLDLRVISGAIIFMGVVALGAAYVPAFRATTVDPRDALAAE